MYPTCKHCGGEPNDSDGCAMHHRCEIAALARQLAKVRGCLAAFAETAEAAVLHHETRGAGGQPTGRARRPTSSGRAGTRR